MEGSAQPETAYLPPSKEQLPCHIGFIMDGNGRWAKVRGLSREAGHRKGAEVFRKISSYCSSLGLQAITVYAFSTENWRRPKKEVDALMRLLEEYLKDDLEEGMGHSIRLKIIGEAGILHPRLRQQIARIQEKSKKNTGMIVNIAFNYGGRDEIIRGARQLAEACLRGELSPKQINETRFAATLYTAGQPDPDLIIRPSGEMRLSNFLSWQSAYSELIFMQVLWPDFTPEHLNYALHQYATRNRRFGGI